MRGSSDKVFVRTLGFLVILILAVCLMKETVKADRFKCSICDQWKEDGTDHCLWCKGCEECVTLCDRCDEWCISCHAENPGIEENAPCPDCGRCKEGVDYCLNCGKCAECAEICSRCGEVCLLCHEENPGIEEYEACPDCGRCKEGVYYCHECGRCAECAEICNICNEVCKECGELVMGDPADEKAPCPDCGECKADGRAYCSECGYCENCVTLCPICGFCEECAGGIGLHCPECGNCYEDVPRCVDGGDHCVECCETCPECGKCLIEAGQDACPYCDLCEDCCEENQCRLCGICEMDPAYEEHFCADCGRCFGEVEQCDGCMLAGELRCEECCEALAKLDGCNCSSPICVNDEYFYEHMSSVHGVTFEGHSATASSAWSLDDTYHWHDCRICGESNHITGKAKHSYNEYGVCTVCGYSADAAIVITSQPKDRRAKVHFIGWCSTSSLETVPPEENTVSFAVTAYGKNAKKDLHYQWYCKHAGINPIPVREGSGLYSGGFCRGAQSPVLTINVETDACYLTDDGNPYEYYCVITDDEGNTVTSDSAKLLAKHDYLLWFEENLKNEKGHVLSCVGDGCPSVSRLLPHEYGEYKWVLKADGTQDYAYRECAVCGYRDIFEAHEHQYNMVALLEAIYNDEVTRVKEDTVNNIYIYEYEPDGHCVRGEFTPTYHSITCSVAGCHFTLKEKHDCSNWSVVNMCSKKAPGAIYRTCSVCEMQETWNKTGYWWHTHPINVRNGHVKEMDGALLEDELFLSRGINAFLLKAEKQEEYDIATEGSAVLILASPVEGKKVVGVNVSIDLKIKGYDDVYTQSLEVKELRDGYAYAFTVPVSDDTYDYQANYVEVEFVYENCTHSKKKTKNAVSATCTGIGYSGDKVCAFCEHLIEKGRYLEPTGHAEGVPATENVYAMNAKGEVATDRDGYKLYAIHMAETFTCEDYEHRGSYTGDMICPNCKEVLIKGKYVEKEHFYMLVNDFDEESKKNLKRNGLREFVPPQNGQDGYSGDYYCEICDKTKWGHVIKSQQFASELKISKKSLTLYDTITIDFKIEKDAIEGKYANPYLVVTQKGVASKLSNYEISPDGKYYVFRVRVAPHELGDVLTVLPCAYNEYGEELKGTPIDYSVAEYCKNVLNSEKYQDAAWATFRRLLVDILLYGDAAQIYTGYKTDSLVSNFLTDAQRSMGTDVNASMNYQSVKKKEYATVDEENRRASLETAALFLEAAVNIQFKYTANDLSGLRMVITDDENGTNVIGDLMADANQIDDKGRYYVTFGGLNAGQMRKTVYATMMKGKQEVSNTYRYSIESYVASIKGKGYPNLDQLLDAMMRYGDSAAAFASGN